MTWADLDFVRAWRNHDDVRQHMFSPTVVSEEDHRRWFERSAADPLRALLIFEREGRPAGFAHFTCGIHPMVADWGFYGAPGSPKGTGRALGRAALRHAFEHLRLHKVCGQVIGSNLRSVKLHRALRFEQEGLLHEQHFDGTRYQDVLCFGLLARQWLAHAKD